MAAILLCLALAAVLVGGMVSKVAVARRQTVIRQRQLQTQWMIESGVRRGLRRLRDDPAFRHESWSIPAAELGGRWSGQVDLQVTEPQDSAPQSLQVTARFPLESQLSVTLRRSIRIPTPEELP